MMETSLKYPASSLSSDAKASTSLSNQKLVWNFLDAASRLLLAIWLGSMVCFSFLVAPSAFKVLPTKHMAGTLVNSVLGKVEWLGLGAGSLLTLLMIITIFITAQHRTWLGKLALLLPVLMTIDCAISKWLISARLVAIRSSMGVDIDQVPATAQLKILFDQLHQYSVGLMGFNLLAGIALLVIHQQMMKQIVWGNVLLENLGAQAKNVRSPITPH